jgi:hypothetical protein
MSPNTDTSKSIHPPIQHARVRLNSPQSGRYFRHSQKLQILLCALCVRCVDKTFPHNETHPQMLIFPTGQLS